MEAISASIAAVGIAALAWDGWRRYLAARSAEYEAALSELRKVAPLVEDLARRIQVLGNRMAVKGRGNG